MLEIFVKLPIVHRYDDVVVGKVKIENSDEQPEQKDQTLRIRGTATGHQSTFGLMNERNLVLPLVGVLRDCASDSQSPESGDLPSTRRRSVRSACRFRCFSSSSAEMSRQFRRESRFP